MCGIAGVYNYRTHGPVDRAILERMNAALIHRGPDDGDVRVEGSLGVAARRLSVVGREGGRQPLASADGTLWIAFNGEIYNFRELRSELLSRGRVFRTETDTEVILHLYDELGDSCVKRLRGMFAFSLVDLRRRRVLLARDRMGEKPLLYSDTGGTLVWASEMSAIVAGPPLELPVDPCSIDLFLGLQYIPSPRTAFSTVKKLPPAHVLVCDADGVRLERYWELPLEAGSRPRGLEEAKEMIRSGMRDAVRRCMTADVPVGAFLSGGVDSTSVVGMMSEMSSRPVKTFAAGFVEDDFSELRYARIAAERFRTDHTEMIVRPEMAAVLPDLAYRFGEPFGDSSALPSYCLTREARKAVTVALTGDGGDENFAGYTRFHPMRLGDLLVHLPKLVRDKLALLAASPPSFVYRHPRLNGYRRLLRDALEAHTVDRYRRQIGILSDPCKEDLYTEGFKSQLRGGALKVTEFISNLFERASSSDKVNQLLHVDFSSYLPECLMVKMDIAAMANSLETRAPLLDHELVESVFRMPGRWKLRGISGSKWIMKSALRDLLPPRIRTRRKMGFGIPIDAWFRGPLKGLWSECVLSPAALERGYFKPERVRRLYEEHVSGKESHGFPMWMLLMLELWHQAYAPRARVV